MILVDTSVWVDHLRRGLGWVDQHLLAATLLAGCRLWTRDKALDAAADELQIAAG